MARRPDRRRPARPDATGRVYKAPPFVMLTREMIESEAYASLDLTDRALLMELRHLYSGSNNGSLYLSARAATARLGLSDFRPVGRAFDNLQDRGFIELAKEAHFAVKSSEASRARCWRLTSEAWPECPVKARRIPTNDWRNYRAPGQTKQSKRADKRLRALADYRKGKAAGQFPVVDSPTTEVFMSHKPAFSVGKTTTRSAENDANPPFVVVGDSTAHIDVTRAMGSSWWWRSDTEAMIGVQLAMLATLIQNRPKLAKAA